MSKDKQYPTATPYLPPKPTLDRLRTAASVCKGCALWKSATQTVFGEGGLNLRVMLVGEQPGDQEDLSGRPFVGPAGRILNFALEKARIDREEVYITNAVKHFKFELRGKRRIHKKPNVGEIHACRPWLEQEIKVIQPEVIVCLGATAAAAILASTKGRCHVSVLAECDFAPGLPRRIGQIHLRATGPVHVLLGTDTHECAQLECRALPE